MTPTHPSIQSFYKREIRIQNTEAPEAISAKPGDGFTEEELADALDPLNRKWNPEREYEELNITQLVPGPRAVTFCGRIVNLNTVHGRNPKQPKASGWHFLIVKDDSAAISVWFHPFLHFELLTILLDQIVLCTKPLSSQARPISHFLDCLCFRHS
jgi:hypothetical protein